MNLHTKSRIFHLIFFVKTFRGAYELSELYAAKIENSHLTVGKTTNFCRVSSTFNQSKLTFYGPFIFIQIAA